MAMKQIKCICAENELMLKQCSNPATQEDLLCDVCRDGARNDRIHAVNPSGLHMTFTSVRVVGFDVN
jgi:hypothetical protein